MCKLYIVKLDAKLNWVIVKCIIALVYKVLKCTSNVKRIIVKCIIEPGVLISQLVLGRQGCCECRILRNALRAPRLLHRVHCCTDVLLHRVHHRVDVFLHRLYHCIDVLLHRLHHCLDVYYYTEYIVASMYNYAQTTSSVGWLGHGSSMQDNIGVLYCWRSSKYWSC